MASEPGARPVADNPSNPPLYIPHRAEFQVYTAVGTRSQTEALMIEQQVLFPIPLSPHGLGLCV